MSNKQSSSELQVQNLIAAVTDALIAGEKDLDSIIDQYDVPRGEVTGLVNVVRRLHVTLVGRQPSPRFVHRLKSDLLGTPGWGVVTRVRYLPARVQIAAAVALIAGFMIFTRRRLVEDAQLDEREVPALQ